MDSEQAIMTKIQEDFTEKQMLRSFQNRMGSYPSEKVGVTNNLKGHATAFGNPCLIDRFVPFHFLQTKRRVFRIIQKKN